MHRSIIVGSPRETGRSAHLAEQIFDACIEDCPQDGVSMISVASVDIAPCIGCDLCKQALSPGDARFVEPSADDDPLSPSEIARASNAHEHRCFMTDGMDEVRAHLDAADELIIVSPIYFSGAPAQLKALLDRLQPYYWSDLWKRTKKRRDLVLHVVGEGDDPNGFEPLIGVVRSACAVAGFRLRAVYDWIGCIDRDGEIIAEAKEYELDQ